MSDEYCALLDRQVLGVIRLTLTKNVAKETTTTGLMNILSDMYEKPSVNNKVHFMKKLFNLKMKEGASVTNHINDFNTIINQLLSVKFDFDEKVCALILMASLPNSWEPMRAAISNSTGSTKLKLIDVRDKILVEEVHRRDSGEITSNALNVETRGKDYDRNSN
ncbi:hypothetical protein Patl1_13861 [Pistacia atlantica]|uniref:Uncharacterized protein n=1 Tax=Pistacia atlantica TaxID=434234 RepID=A0ACC1ATH4_9ROSI|nr:hypothetical protein Patl1_13861 [Pistacia atlantica]